MIELTVIGTPQPQGSLKRTRWGMIPDNPNTKPWRATVAAAAAEVWAERRLINEPIKVDALFVFARPKGHFRTGRNAHLLRENAPVWCQTRPDVDKLARAIGDSLAGVMLRDDSLIVQWRIRKVYGAPARCELRISVPDEQPGDAIMAAGDGWL